MGVSMVLRVEHIAGSKEDRERERKREKKRDKEREERRERERERPQTLILLRKRLLRSQSVACAEEQALSWRLQV